MCVGGDVDLHVNMAVHVVVVVCDECLVQRVVFLWFSAIDHCGCQDTYNFLFEKN